jgi:hypothetical protein
MVIGVPVDAIKRREQRPLLSSSPKLDGVFAEVEEDAVHVLGPHQQYPHPRTRRASYDSRSSALASASMALSAARFT